MLALTALENARDLITLPISKGYLVTLLNFQRASLRHFIDGINYHITGRRYFFDTKLIKMLTL